MSSTTYQTYLNYISTWEHESDNHIDKLIEELNVFSTLSDFESDSIINNEFIKLVSLVNQMKSNAIGADVAAIGANVAAVSSVFSLGLGMALFVALEAQSSVYRLFLKDETKDLMENLAVIDERISKGISPDVSLYIDLFKNNNRIISSKAPIGMDGSSCRSILFQFMAFVKAKESLTAESFRRYAGLARKAFESDEINAIYDALDDLNLSKRTNSDIEEFEKKISAPKLFSHGELSFIQLAALTAAGYRRVRTDYRPLDIHAEASGDVELTGAGGQRSDGSQPSEGESQAGSSVTENPAVEGPVVEGPGVEGPVVEGPVVEGPVVEGPVVEGPVVEGPVVEGPVLFDNLPPPERISSLDTTYKNVDFCGKIAFAVAAIAAVIQIFVEILDIVDNIKKYDDLSDKLMNEVAKSYRDFFNGIKEASLHYQQAIKKQ
ncbi:hypothetical protein [Pantoea ananatis]|uniref:hypothetical protein n=1 Tax=Pantoea ananas TaxID=553 RepID=UPI000E381BF1|nr:hypothetical protein [Pantoea ananatis]REE67485.1 hypothetical protein C7424_3907 [Pantoea ananatis]